jgi:hypothetical protein
MDNPTASLFSVAPPTSSTSYLLMPRWFGVVIETREMKSANPTCKQNSLPGALCGGEATLNRSDRRCQLEKEAGHGGYTS